MYHSLRWTELEFHSCVLALTLTAKLKLDGSKKSEFYSSFLACSVVFFGRDTVVLLHDFKDRANNSTVVLELNNSIRIQLYWGVVKVSVQNLPSKQWKRSPPTKNCELSMVLFVLYFVKTKLF